MTSHPGLSPPTSIYLSSLWPSTTPLPLTTLYPPVSPSPTTSTVFSIVTTSSVITPAPDSPPNVAITIATLTLLIIFASLVILGCLVGILFFKVSRKIKVQEESKASSIRNSRGRVISVSSSTYASVNERGRIRRHGRREDSQQCSVRISA